MGTAYQLARHLARKLDQSVGSPLIGIIRAYRNQVLSGQFPLSKDVVSEIQEIVDQIDQYWYSATKRRVLVSLIIKHQLKRTVEIGVFTGGSFVPQIVAVKRTGGRAIGIDPYSATSAVQQDNRDILDPLSEEIEGRDWNAVYEGLLDLLKRYRLSEWCEIMRMTSDDAAQHIEPGFDLLHIDGNHDFDRVRADILNYVPKLRLGGFLLMDDIGWSTITPQYVKLKKQMRLIYEESESWGCLEKIGEVEV